MIGTFGNDDSHYGLTCKTMSYGLARFLLCVFCGNLAGWFLLLSEKATRLLTWTEFFDFPSDSGRLMERSRARGDRAYISQDGVGVTHLAHDQKTAGSNPAPAPIVMKVRW